MLRASAALVLLIFFNATNAAIITIDFEGVVDDSSSMIPASPYTENGMVVDSLQAEHGIFGKDSTFTNGSAIYGWCNVNVEGFCMPGLITITQAQNAEFDLLSFEASVFNNYGSVNGPLSITGNYAAGGNIQAEISLADDSWDTFIMNNQWTGLISLELHGDDLNDYDIGIDNVVVSTIPIPAAVWLFGSGLALLGWMRRRVS
jgi:hypothetical protein